MEFPPALGPDGEGMGEKGAECRVFGEINREGPTIGVETMAGQDTNLGWVGGWVGVLFDASGIAKFHDTAFEPET